MSKTGKTGLYTELHDLVFVPKSYVMKKNLLISSSELSSVAEKQDLHYGKTTKSILLYRIVLTNSCSENLGNSQLREVLRSSPPRFFRLYQKQTPP